MALELLFILTVTNVRKHTEVIVKTVQKTNNKIFGIIAFLRPF